MTILDGYTSDSLLEGGIVQEVLVYSLGSREEKAFYETVRQNTGRVSYVEVQTKDSRLEERFEIRDNKK